MQKYLFLMISIRIEEVLVVFIIASTSRLFDSLHFNDSFALGMFTKNLKSKSIGVQSCIFDHCIIAQKVITMACKLSVLIGNRNRKHNCTE